MQAALERCLVKWRKVQRAESRDAYVHRILVHTFVSARRRRWTGERQVVVLRHYAHLSEQQTATALGVAPGTVKSRLSRGLRALAQDPDLLELRGAR